MDDYLVKPFKVEELQAVLERYLQLEPASATA
jgi:DNA-binding response OmpR family regulator